jgi:hypothetical protein
VQSRYEGGIEPSPISVENLPQLSDNSASSEVSQLSIRDRLRLWEAENVARGGNAFVVHERGDLAPDGTFGNAGMRILDSQHYRTEEETLELAQSSLPLFETEDLVGFGNERSFLLQGDLVELRLVLDYLLSWEHTNDGQIGPRMVFGLNLQFSFEKSGDNASFIRYLEDGYINHHETPNFSYQTLSVLRRSVHLYNSSQTPLYPKPFRTHYRTLKTHFQEMSVLLWLRR